MGDRKAHRNIGSWTTWGLMVGLGLALAVPAHGYEQRSNTFSVGIQGGGGLGSGSGDYRPGTEAPLLRYEDFDLGLGLSLHVRYSLDRTHAIGFTFEDLRFERKTDAPALLAANFENADELQLNNFMAQYYIYFNRRAKMSRYLTLGAGFHRATFRFDNGENIIPGEGLIANLGAGLEYFIQRQWSIDASVIGYFVKPDGGSLAAGEFFLGIHYYLVR